MAQRIADNASKRLAKYWFRAELMRDIVHTVVEETDDLKNLPKRVGGSLRRFCSTGSRRYSFWSRVLTN